MDKKEVRCCFLVIFFLKKIFWFSQFSIHQGKGTAFEAAGLRIGQTIISVDGRPMQGENLRRPFFIYFYFILFYFFKFSPFFFCDEFLLVIIHVYNSLFLYSDALNDVDRISFLRNNSSPGWF